MGDQYSEVTTPINYTIQLPPTPFNPTTTSPMPTSSHSNPTSPTPPSPLDAKPPHPPPFPKHQTNSTPLYSPINQNNPFNAYSLSIPLHTPARMQQKHHIAPAIIIIIIPPLFRAHVFLLVLRHVSQGFADDGVDVGFREEGAVVVE